MHEIEYQKASLLELAADVPSAVSVTCVWLSALPPGVLGSVSLPRRLQLTPVFLH